MRLFLGVFSSCWVAMFKFDMIFSFHLIVFIMFSCSLLEASYFLTGDRNGVDLEGWGGGGNWGKGRETIIRIYSREKNLF